MSASRAVSSSASSSSSGSAASSHFEKMRAVDRLAPANVKHNHDVVFFTRTLVSILGGCCCGILGLTNWSGFAFYLVTALLTSVVLLGKLAATAAASGGLADAKSYVGSLSAITTDGLIDGCMSYVLFWTLLYDIVYVY